MYYNKAAQSNDAASRQSEMVIIADFYIDSLLKFTQITIHNVPVPYNNKTEHDVAQNIVYTSEVF